MNLNKLEKIQFVYDLLGTLISALCLAAVCAVFFDSDSDQISSKLTFWETLPFYIPLLIYSVFLNLFWKGEQFKKFRLNVNWIFVSLSGTTCSILLTFPVGEQINEKLFTSKSIFHSLSFFLFMTGVLISSFLFLMFCFWVIGLIHRISIGNGDERILLNLRTKI